MDRERLKGYRHVVKECEVLEEKILRKMSETQPKAQILKRSEIAKQKMDKVNADKIGDLIAEIDALKSDYLRIYLNRTIQHREIFTKINNIKNDSVRLVMSLKYLEGRTLEVIANEMNYSLQGIKRLHRIGINKINSNP